MTGILAIGAVTAAASSVAVLGSWAWIRFRQIKLTPQNEQDCGFSQARYEPITRLLSEDEWDFVRRRTGCRPEAAARWNRRRHRVFRMYLTDLSRDFLQLHAQARALVAESPEQHADLVGVLIRQQFTFWRVMAGMEFRLLLHSIGWGRIDARALVAVIESMRLEIDRSLSPASA